MPLSSVIIICQGIQEFRISANLNTPEQCSTIYKTPVGSCGVD